MFEIDGKNALNMARAMCGGSSEPRRTDLDCPECESKLVFPEPGIVHMEPPRKRVKCLSCRYKGWHEVPHPGPAIDITNHVTPSLDEKEC